MTYVLIPSSSDHAIIIDPGSSDPEPLRNYLQETGLSVDFIALTHEHFDHIAGVEELRKSVGCPVICSRACSIGITDPKLNFSRYLVGHDIVCGEADKFCDDIGWVLERPGVRLRFLDTPGHSPGSICIAVNDLLFTGDTLLPSVKRVVKLPGGCKIALEKSLASLFACFSSETMVYPGHGEPFPLYCAFKPSV